MASVGPTYPTVASVEHDGNCEWSNESYILADDANAATCDLPDGAGYVSDTIVGHTFGFSIPTTATIQGIEVAINAKGVGGNEVGLGAQLYYGSMVGDTLPGGLLPLSYTTKYFGGPTSLWGYSWTPAIINSFAFGVGARVDNSDIELDATGYINYIRATIYYSLANLRPKVSGAWKDGTPSVKVGGAWKNVAGIWTKVSGVWKQSA